MPEQTTLHNTFVIERTFSVTPERAFAAFSDPAQKRRWYAEGGSHNIEDYEMDFRPGGIERAAYRLKAVTPFPEASLTNEGTFLDIVANRRIVISSTMALEGRRFSASLVTFEFLKTRTGTDLIFTHQGVFFEESDGPVIRESGWTLLLSKLEDELAG